MKSTQFPAPDVALKEISPAARLIHEAVEAGVMAAQRYFGKLDRKIDPYLAADLVRYHAVLYIDQRAPKIKGLRREPLPNNGLEIHFGTYRIRVRKSDEGDLPSPGPSQTMQAFYQQRLSGWAEITGDDSSGPVNLLIVWDASRSYVLGKIMLVCPKHGSDSRKSAEKRWEIAIPHPAFMPRTAQPKPASAPAAVDTEDLPFTRKKPSMTGTENTDD